MLVYPNLTLYFLTSFLKIILICYSYKPVVYVFNGELTTSALNSQALESIEKAQELAEGLGNKVRSYSFFSALFIVLCQAI